MLPTQRADPDHHDQHGSRRLAETLTVASSQNVKTKTQGLGDGLLPEDDFMPDNGQSTRHYVDAVQAQLGERVTNLGRRQSDLENEMRSGFRQIEQSFAAFTNETRASINALTSTLAERNKPQWQAIGVALTFAVIIGGMAYWPIREATTDLKTNVSTLASDTRQAFAAAAERFITREELNWRSARSSEDRQRMESAIADLRATMLPRNEWSERNLNRDHDIANIRNSLEREVSSLQRQIDTNRGDFQSFANSMGNGRDIITDMKDELERLRDQLADIRARQFQSP